MSPDLLIDRRFEINDLEKDLLGCGGMGEVYRATDIQSGEVVAIKALNPEVLRRSPDLLERFRREGEALRQLNHPNIVRMIAAAQEQELHYLVVEYVSGGSLAGLLAAQGRLPAMRVIEIGLDLADALTRAHRLGIIHRDLKPANVLLAEDGTPRLADFGIAHLESEERLTQTGLLMGTVDYFSPEMCQGKPPDERSDIWAFGVLLFEMLSGRLPFEGDNLTARLTAIVTEPVPDLGQLAPEAPAGLIDLVNRMLVKDPQERIPSVRLVGAELEALLKGREPVTPWRDPAGSLATAPTHNLPLPLTSFIGRDSQIVEVKRLLRPPSTLEGVGGRQERLLTLVGLGGSGKTRLAIEAARGMVDEFADGVWWIDLSALSDPDLVTQTVASTLGIWEQPGHLLIETLSDAFRSRRILLVLDNCEHLFAACRQLAVTLLQSCPFLYILATSQAALNVAGEMIWPVLPLAVPDLQHPFQSAADPISFLSQYESVRLFVERAAAVYPGFSLTEQNFVAVAQICRRLDGIPLAIELAAARVKVLTPQQIASRLDDLFHMLTRGAGTAIPRHQTLRATVDWSYQLLIEPDQVLLRRLSVFAGSFSMEAAEAICTGDCLEEKEILDSLSDLVDKSLVLVSEEEGLQERRYKLLEMIRQYGKEKLEEAGEAEQARAQHLDFYLRLAEEAEPELRRAEQIVWLRRLEAEIDNLREALTRAVAAQGSMDSGQIQSGEPGLRLAGALWYFWETRGLYTDGRTWLERTLATGSDAPSAERAKALTGLGSLAWHQGNYKQALTYHEAALAAYRIIGDPTGIAFALNNIGMQYLELGLYDRADGLFEDALARYLELGDAWGIGLVLNNHGYAAYNRGDTQRAINLIQESLPYLRQAADKRFLALVLQNLGELAQDQEDYDTVIFRYEESLSLFQEFGESLYAKDWVLRMWGDLALIRGDIEQADQVFRKRLRVCRESGNKYAMIETLERLTKVLEAQGKLQAATQLLSAAEALRRANDMPLPIPLQPAHERMAKGLRAGLGEAAFAKAWVGGQVLTLEQAYQFALSQSILDEPAPRPEPESIPARLPSRREATKQKYGGLTTKEREVAALVVQGKTNREIAEELFVGLKTVEAHITRILQKLGFTSRAQIAAWAVAKGLAEAPTDLDTLARGI